MKKSPFWKSYFRVSVGEIEFRYFKDLALPKVLSMAQEIDRFQPLEDIYSFYINNSRPEALQLWFGNRSMFRLDSEGKGAAERGGALLYTIGPTGKAAVILFPATSSLARPFEDHIFLRIGNYSGYELFKRLPRDLRDLVSYCHVTSLDGDPTLSEQFRIGWLRRVHPMHVKGEFTRPMTFQYGSTAFEFTMRTMFIALLKPLAILVIIVLLIRFGMPQLADLLKH